MAQRAEGYTERVRAYAREHYIEPARKRGENTVKIVSGDIYRALRVPNVVPSVCAALKSRKFLAESRLTLENIQGPPSGQSTTVVFQYKLLGLPAGSTARTRADAFLRLRGLGKKTFSALGGGEAFLRKERKEFLDASDRLQGAGTNR